MSEQKQTELRRAEYYKKNLQRIDEFFEPAVHLEKAEKPFSDSMVGEFVLAPFLTLFAIWALQSAKRDGVKKLYFLARDGYPAYKAASELCDKYSLGIECKYFYCSRYSLRVPMYSENQDEMLDYICRSGIDVTLRKILRRSGLTESQIAELETDLKDTRDLDTIISYSELNDVRRALGKNNDFLNMVQENSEKAWDNLAHYFAQEGFLTDEHIGIVDSGWIGSTQKSIEDILKRMGKSVNIDGYYWGLYDLPNNVDASRYHGFYFDKKHEMLNKLMFSNCLVEAVFSVNHGTTISYRQGENGISPVLSGNYFNGEFVLAFNEVIEHYLEYFATMCTADSIQNMDTRRYMHILAKSLRKYMISPTKGEASTFGALMFSDDLLDDNGCELGPVFSIEEIKRNHFLNRVLNALGHRSNYIHESAWFSATVRRSTNNIFWHNLSFMFYRWLSYIKKSI